MHQNFVAIDIKQNSFPRTVCACVCTRTWLYHSARNHPPGCKWPEFYCILKADFFWIIYFEWHRIAANRFFFCSLILRYLWLCGNWMEGYCCKAQGSCWLAAALHINIINILFMRFFRICLLVAYVRLFFCWFAVPEGAFAFIHVQLTVFHFHSTVLECLNIDNCCVPFFSSFCWMQRYCCMRLCFNSLILLAHPLNNVGTQTLWKKSANMAIILCYCTWNRRWNRIVRERKKDQNVINRLQLNCCLLCCAIKCVCAIRAHSSIECILITSFELISFFTACFVFFFMFGFHFFLSGLLLLLLFSCCHQ